MKSTYFQDKELAELSGEMSDILRKQKHILNKAKNEDRELTDSEIAKYDELEAEFSRKRKRKTELERAGAKMPNTSALEDIGVQIGTSKNEYNLMRVIRYLANPFIRDHDMGDSDAGLEREVSQELRQKTGVDPESGILVPFRAIVPREQREVTFSGTGSNLVQTEIPDDFISALRNHSHVLSFNPTVLNDLQGNLSIPRVGTGTSGSWISGDAKASTFSAETPSLESLDLSPKFVGGLVEVTMRMTVQSNPAVSEVVENDLRNMIGEAVDLAAVDGSGSSNEPQGIMGTSGISVTTTSSSSGPTWSELLTGGPEKVLSNKAKLNNPGWISHTGQYSYLKSTDKGSDTGKFLAEDSTMDGAPVRFSDHVPSGHFLFGGDWKDLIISNWSSIVLAVDPYTNFDSGGIRLRAHAVMDIGTRHIESFAYVRNTTS